MEWIQLEVDSRTYDCQDLGTIAGVGAVRAIDGIPPRFLTELARMSQVVEVPHTWRVAEAATVEEVGQETIDIATQVIIDDTTDFGARIISYVVDRDDGLELVAAGAVRNKLNRDFGLIEFPVVSRAVVAPHHRGKGLGSLMIKHRLNLARDFFAPAKAIHMATVSEKVSRVADQFAQESGWRRLYVGDEVLSVKDGDHREEDFLFLDPDYELSLLSESHKLGAAFAERFATFITKGAAASSGDDMAELVDGTVKCPLLSEFFTVRRNIGAKDPAPA